MATSIAFHCVSVGQDGSAESADPHTANCLFPWWSFSKTVLAICALRLVEDGRLSLDGPISQQGFTLRQLLQHRAGVASYGRLAAYHEAVARNDVPWSRTRLLEAVRADRLLFSPGTGWAYSNVGYMYVGDAIARASGTDLGSALARIVLDPLRLASARLATASGSFDGMHWPAVRRYDPRWVFHGCLTGTARDAARLLSALMSGQLLTNAMLQAMLETHALGGALTGRPWTRHGYGLGLMSGRMGEAGRAIGHSGAGPSCSNAVYHFPDLLRPVTVACFTDAEDEGIAEAEALRVAIDSQD